MARAKKAPARKAPAAKSDGQDFPAVFDALRQILARHAGELFVKYDKPGHYYVETISPSWKCQRMFFGAAAIKKNYLSFYLMPVYCCPELLKGMSPDLKKRMQGKACFNFTRVEKKALQELAALTAAGFDSFRKAKFL